MQIKEITYETPVDGPRTVAPLVLWRECHELLRVIKAGDDAALNGEESMDLASGLIALLDASALMLEPNARHE